MDRPLRIEALLSRELTPLEYRVWSYLHWRQGANSHAWPSQRVIADDLELTIQGVRNITRRLERKGWLSVAKPDRPGRGHAIEYRVTGPDTKVNGGLPISETKGSTASEPFDREKVNHHPKKGSTMVDPNTIQRTHTEISSVPISISFDQESGRFVGLTSSRRRRWAEAYPDIDVAVEICQAEAWYVANPTRRKKNHARFLTNWLSRAEREQRYGNTEARQYQRPQQRTSFREQVSSIGERVEV